MFSPPSHFIVHETAHWRVNQRTDAALPGYLIVSARDDAATSFEELSTAALAELGPALRDAVSAIERTLTPERVYVTRYGHSPGHSIHFHVIPLYSWVVAAFRHDTRYRALEQFYASHTSNDFDGPDMCLFISREFARSLTPPINQQLSLDSAIDLLRRAFAPSKLA